VKLYTIAARAVKEFNLPNAFGLRSRGRMIPLITTSPIIKILVENILRMLPKTDLFFKV